MSILYTANVLVRQFAVQFASKIAWIEEVCLFGLVWMVFLGLGLALEQGRHIAMTSVLLRFGFHTRRTLKIVIDLVGLVFSLYVAQICFEITLAVLKTKQVSPTLNISISWLYGPMPVGFLALGLRYALELLGADRHSREQDPTLSV
jgi:C4-dicarboxylate transporter DctQ subunit